VGAAPAEPDDSQLERDGDRQVDTGREARAVDGEADQTLVADEDADRPQRHRQGGAGGDRVHGHQVGHDDEHLDRVRGRRQQGQSIERGDPCQRHQRHPPSQTQRDGRPGRHDEGDPQVLAVDAVASVQYLRSRPHQKEGRDDQRQQPVP
jgi:hypothetical protein